MILKRKFYECDTLKVARELLGCFLVRKLDKKIIRGIITETEAYVGEDDLACHASKGRTPRTEIMYGKAGRAYVYMIYGMYHCLNIVTENKDFPAAVLIRKLANISELKANSRKFKKIEAVELNGPGKLCKFLKIDRKLNGSDITKKGKLWVASPRLVRLGRKKLIKKNIVASKRIGIDYAEHCKNYLWRFLLKSEK
ncbi:MAG: DNA-3-methyladenine glycosylase [bacterium]|nr:DNA-3-methyladenine glycosylase [bacterium]